MTREFGPSGSWLPAGDLVGTYFNPSVNGLSVWGGLDLFGSPWTGGLQQPGSWSFAAPSLANSRLTSGDYNGDGWTDIAIFEDIGGGSSRLYVAAGSSGGVPAAPYLVWSSGVGGFPAANVSDIASADVNSDGRADVVMRYDYAGPSSGLWVWYGTVGPFGVPNLPAASQGPLGNWLPNATRLTAGDLDDDGFGDVVVLHWTTATSVQIVVFPGSSSGPLAPVTVWNMPSGSMSVTPTGSLTAGDFTGDGLYDVVTLYDSGSGAQARLWPGVNGAFGVPGVANWVFAWGPISGLSVPGVRYASQDLNSDGVSDLAIIDDLGSSAVRLLVSAGGPLTAPPSNASYTSCFGCYLFSSLKLAD